ncbi:MAG: amidase [Aquabacterium sp.]
MRLDEYTTHDATGLAGLVARREVTPHELAALAMQAIEAVNPRLNAVVETYADRIEGLDESTLGAGPLRGVPFLMKDVFGHEAGRRVEFGSRLCRGMVALEDSVYCKLVRAAGLNIIGRSAAPEYSMAGTTEGALYGNTSTPWRHGYSAGGSSGGAAAAVGAGIVPVAQGTDIAGSVRIPASYCGGIGLKPSRGRVSYAPMLDENGYGLGQNFAQTRSLRDTALLMDLLAVPQVGDPFAIPRPAGSWLDALRHPAPRLRIGFSTAALMGVAVDPEVAAAVQATARRLQDMGHVVEEVTPQVDGLAAMRAMMELWFFGFDLKLAGYSARSGHPVGPDTLEPVIQQVLAHARGMTAAHFIAGMAQLNTVRRQYGAVFARHDIWLTPTTARTAETWGRYNLGRTDVAYDDIAPQVLAPVAQHTLPHNVMGTPAISLPLALHSNGLPIGVQLAAAPAHEDWLLQLAAALEQAQPFVGRPPLG